MTYHHGSNLFGTWNNESDQMPGLDTTTYVLQKLLPLQAHHVPKQTEFGSHEHLLGLLTRWAHPVKVEMHQNLLHHTQHPAQLLYVYQKQCPEPSANIIRNDIYSSLFEPYYKAWIKTEARSCVGIKNLIYLIQIFVGSMYELSSTSWEFELIFILCNPILSSFILNQLRMRYIAKPYLW